MAVDFSTKATELQGPRYNAYIKQGVVDKSSVQEAEAFKIGTQAAEYGLTMAKEYDKFNTLKGVAEEIGQIMQEQEDRSYAGQASLTQETEDLKNQMGLAQDKAGYDQTYPSVLNQELTDQTRGVQNALAEKTDRLTRAREQGAMTEFELETRLNAIAREAIARNPALAPDVIKHVSTVSNMNNLTEKVKIDAKILEGQQKTAEAYSKSIIKQAEAKGSGINLALPKYYDPATGGYNIPQIQQDLARNEKYITANELIENEQTLMESGLKLNTQKLINSGLMFDIGDARVMKSGIDFDAILEGEGTEATKIEKIKLSAVNNYEKVLRAYNARGIDTTNPAVKQALDSMKSRIDSRAAMYIENIGNANQLKIVKDNLALQENMSKEKLYRIKGLTDQIALGEMLNNITGPYGGLAEKEAVQNKALEIISNSQSDMADPEKALSNAELFKVEPGSRMSAYSGAGNSYRQQYLNNPNEETKEALNKHISKGLSFISNPENVNKTDASGNLVNLIADPRTTDAVVKAINPNIKGSLRNLIMIHGEGMNQTQVQPILELMVQRNDGSRLLRMDDGTITVQPGSGVDVDPRLLKAVGGLDDTFRAYHKISGNNSIDKSFTEFYSPMGLFNDSQK
jgi:hypothetical protein